MLISAEIRSSEVTERFAEHAFGFRGIGDITGSHGLASGFRYRLKGSSFVLHIALGRFDEI